MFDLKQNLIIVNQLFNDKVVKIDRDKWSEVIDVILTNNNDKYFGSHYLHPNMRL